MPKSQPMPPQFHTPVHAWAGGHETMLVPQLKAGVVKTFEQFVRSLPDIESHHLVVFDSKAG